MAVGSPDPAAIFLFHQVRGPGGHCNDLEISFGNVDKKNPLQRDKPSATRRGAFTAPIPKATRMFIVITSPKGVVIP